MKRRTVLRGVGVATTAAVGVTGTAAAMDTGGDGEGATHVAYQAADGSLEFVKAENADVETEICPPPEDSDCCRDCPCYPCHCVICNRDEP